MALSESDAPKTVADLPVTENCDKNCQFYWNDCHWQM